MLVSFQHIQPNLIRNCVLILGLWGLLILSPNRGNAQFWEPGASVFGTMYQGDLSDHMDPRYATPGISLFLRTNLSNAVALRYEVLATTIAFDGKNSSNKIANNLNGSSFSTPFLEGSMCLEYHWFDYRKYKSDKRGTPYFFLGLAAYMHQPVPVEGDGDVSPTQLAIPFGVGYKYALSRHWNIGLEFGPRKTFNRFLDNSSDVLPNSPSNPDQIRPQRGYKNFDDWYGLLQLRVSYTFYGVECPFPDWW